MFYNTSPGLHTKEIKPHNVEKVTYIGPYKSPSQSLQSIDKKHPKYQEKVICPRLYTAELVVRWGSGVSYFLFPLCFHSKLWDENSALRWDQTEQTDLWGRLLKDSDDWVDRRTKEKGVISKLQFLVSGAEMNKAAHRRNKLSLGEAGRVGLDVFHLLILSFIHSRNI